MHRERSNAPYPMGVKNEAVRLYRASGTSLSVSIQVAMDADSTPKLTVRNLTTRKRGAAGNVAYLRIKGVDLHLGFGGSTTSLGGPPIASIQQAPPAPGSGRAASRERGPQRSRYRRQAFANHRIRFWNRR